MLEHSADCFESIVVPGPPRIVTGSFRSTIAFWDAKTLERLPDESISTPHATQVNALQYDEPTGVLASGGDTGKVCLWRLSDHTLLDEFQVDAPSHANKVICFAFSGDGRWLAASTFDHTEDIFGRNTTVSIYDRQHHRLAQTLRGFGQRPKIHFSPAGELLVTSSTGEIGVWRESPAAATDADVAAFEHVLTRKLSEQPIWSSQLLSDGRRLVIASGSWDDSEAHPLIEVWDTSEWRLLKSARLGVPGLLNEMDVDQDRWLLLGGPIGNVILVDLESLVTVARRKVHTGPILDVRFSPDGELICTASRDNTAKVWRRDRFVSRDSETVIDHISPTGVDGAFFAASNERVCEVAPPERWSSGTSRRAKRPVRCRLRRPTPT